MTPEAKSIMFDLMVECDLTLEEIRCADNFNDSQLPWRSQYEMAPVSDDEVTHSDKTQ
jgi:hypothetical protein